MITRLHAVVLGVYDTGESSEVAHVLSAEHGPISVMAKGARRRHSNVAAALQPLALAELTVHMHEDSDIATLREACSVHAHSEFSTNPSRLAAGSVLAEVASAGCIAHQPAREMVELLVRSLDDLAVSPDEALDARMALWLLRILSVSGHSPAISEDVLARRGAPRPSVFWLELGRGRVTLDGSQPTTPPSWPLLPAREDHYPLPPEAVRLIHESRGGGGDASAGRLDPARARQLVTGLILHAEHHLDRRLRAARFWKSVPSGG